MAASHSQVLLLNAGLVTQSLVDGTSWTISVETQSVICYFFKVEASSD